MNNLRHTVYILCAELLITFLFLLALLSVLITSPFFILSRYTTSKFVCSIENLFYTIVFNHCISVITWTQEKTPKEFAISLNSPRIRILAFIHLLITAAVNSQEQTSV